MGALVTNVPYGDPGWAYSVPGSVSPDGTELTIWIYVWQDPLPADAELILWDPVTGGDTVWMPVTSAP